MPLSAGILSDTDANSHGTKTSSAVCENAAFASECEILRPYMIRIFRILNFTQCTQAVWIKIPTSFQHAVLMKPNIQLYLSRTVDILHN